MTAGDVRGPGPRGMVTDLRAARSRFPVLRDRIYCDNASFGAFPEEMLADLEEYRRTLFLRSRAIDGWLALLEEVTRELEGLLHAPAGSLALRENATGAQAAIAAAVEPRGARRNIVIAPELDFDSSRFLWTQQARRGFELVEVGRGRHDLGADELRAAIDERTAVVALPLVSPRTGALLPIAEVTAHARQCGALTVIDAYQAAGIVPLEVERLGADVVVSGMHKWLYGGGTGLAFMYVAPAAIERLPVVYPGWLGHHRLLDREPRFEPAPGARRFQQGTPPMEPVYTARAGLRFVAEAGVAALRARSLELTARLLERAAAHGLSVLTPAEAGARGGMICIAMPDADAHTVVQQLRARGIDVGARPGAGVRVAPHPCLDTSDCDDVIAQIAQIAQIARS